MEPHFILKSYEDKEQKRLIQLVYSHGGKQVRLNTGIKVREKDFSKQKILASVKEHDKNPVKLNDELRELKMKVEKIVSDYRFQHKMETSYDLPPSVDYVKRKFFERAKDGSNEFGVLRNFKQWLADKRKKVKQVRGYETLLKDLQDFIGNQHICFKDITHPFLSNLLDYYMAREEISSNDTIKKKFSLFKTFLKEVGEVNHYTHYLNFSLKHLKGNNENENIYTLTDKEYELMKKFEVEDKAQMYARDLFLLGCNTSFRYSDLFELNQYNTRNGMIDLTTSKTGAFCKVPVTEQTKQILEKYDYSLKYYENAYINKNLHVYMFHFNNYLIKQEIHTLNEPTLKISRKGVGDPKKVYTPKWKLITMHSSRKFFFTRLTRAGLSKAEIRSYTGNVDVYWRYVYGGNEHEIESLF